MQSANIFSQSHPSSFVYLMQYCHMECHLTLAPVYMCEINCQLLINIYKMKKYKTINYKLKIF